MSSLSLKASATMAAIALLASGGSPRLIHAQASVPAHASLTAQDRLWDAAIAGDTTAIAQAITDGANVDSLDTRRNQNGRRALNWAAWNDRAPAIRLLIARGATVNLANRTGFTPLHHAAENGSAEAATALLELGADPTMVNAQSQLPADVARERGHPGIAAQLDAAPTPLPTK